MRLNQNQSNNVTTMAEEAERNQTFPFQPIVNGSVQADPLQPISNTLAIARGCDPGYLSRVDPQWVSVNPGDFPFIAEGVVKSVSITHEDWPFNHFSHDFNFDVVLDPLYRGLYSDAAKVINGEPVIENEWEIGYNNYRDTDRFPPMFWPWPGDRVWMEGRWIFDCGHYNVRVGPDGGIIVDGFTTEIHPPRAVAFMRTEPIFFTDDKRLPR